MPRSSVPAADFTAAPVEKPPPAQGPALFIFLPSRRSAVTLFEPRQIPWRGSLRCRIRGSLP